MSHQTIFRQDLHANDVIMEDLTEQLQSRVPANTPMGLRAVVILNQAQRSGSGAATIAPVNTISKTVARKPTGGVARRKNLGDALGKGAKAQLQQRLIVDVKKGKLFKPSIASVDGDESKKADEPKNSETKKPETDLEVYGTSAGGRLLGDEAYFTAFGKPIEAAKVREENIKNAANPKFHSSHVQNEERVITQVAKLYYFYYMDITPEHVRDIAGRLAMTGDDERMGILQGQFEELKVKFEKGIWGSKAFIDFVSVVGVQIGCAIVNTDSRIGRRRCRQS